MLRKKYREVYNFFSAIKKEHGKSERIAYKIKFIDSLRSMSSSLSSLADNVSERGHSGKCTDCKSCPHYM